MADSGVMDFIDHWLHDGQCTNNTGHDITICIDGNPGKLGAGETSPKSVDCDGVIHDDGSATKIYGASGVKEHKDPPWVRDHWPRCYEAAPHRPEGHGGGGAFRIVNVNPDNLILPKPPPSYIPPLPSVFDLVAAKGVLAGMSLNNLMTLLKRIKSADANKLLSNNGETRVLVPESLIIEFRRLLFRE